MIAPLKQVMQPSEKPAAVTAAAKTFWRSIAAAARANGSRQTSGARVLMPIQTPSAMRRSPAPMPIPRLASASASCISLPA